MTAIGDLDLLARAATLYYKHSLPLRAIAARLDVSVMTVSRLLKRARRSGVVTITIRTPFRTVPHLEAELAQACDLKSASVVANPYGEDLVSLLGRAAAYQLDALLTDSDVLGVAAGRTSAAMVESLRPRALPKLQVAQLMGGLGLVDRMNPFNLVQRVCERLGAQGRYLFAPAYAADPRTRDQLVPELTRPSGPGDLWNVITLCAFGLGVAGAKSIYVEAGFIKPAVMSRLVSAGAVGDLLGYFFDEGGAILDDPVNRRVMGISIEQVRKIPQVIAAAGGRHKIRAIRGALRTGCISHLVTDADTAREVLRGR